MEGSFANPRLLGVSFLGSRKIRVLGILVTVVVAVMVVVIVVVDVVVVAAAAAASSAVAIIRQIGVSTQCYHHVGIRAWNAVVIVVGTR